MNLIDTLGKLLKYESRHIFSKDAAVLVSLTPQEWADLQKAAADAEASPLKEIATAAIARATTVANPAKGVIDVSLAAGDYHALDAAHEAVAPPEPDAPPAEKTADPRDAKIAELEAKLADQGKAKSTGSAPLA